MRRFPMPQEVALLCNQPMGRGLGLVRPEVALRMSNEAWGDVFHVSPLAATFVTHWSIQLDEIGIEVQSEVFAAALPALSMRTTDTERDRETLARLLTHLKCVIAPIIVRAGLEADHRPEAAQAEEQVIRCQDRISASDVFNRDMVGSLGVGLDEFVPRIEYDMARARGLTPFVDLPKDRFTDAWAMSESKDSRALLILSGGWAIREATLVLGYVNWAPATAVHLQCLSRIAQVALDAGGEPCFYHLAEKLLDEGKRALAILTEENP